MDTEHNIRNRFASLRRTQYIQVNNDLLILNKPSLIIYVGIDQGLLVEEQVPPNYRSIRHPNLPLMFEYNCRRLNSGLSTFPHSGKFIVTSEAGHNEETDIGLRTALNSQGSYNAYYEAKLVVSPKKRVFNETEETENHEELRCDYNYCFSLILNIQINTTTLISLLFTKKCLQLPFPFWLVY